MDVLLSERKFLDFLNSLKSIDFMDINDIHNKFTTYQQIVYKYNLKFNMISHNDIEKIWTRHFQDSLIPLLLFPEQFRINSFLENSFSNKINLKDSLNHINYSETINKKSKIDIIDLGTGAGLPGIPLSILLNHHKFNLVESNKKKHFFLENVLIPILKLKNVEAICNRAENLVGNRNYKDSFEIVLTRGMAKFPAALKLSLPFLKIGGFAFFWLGSEISESDIRDIIEKNKGFSGGIFLKEQEYYLPNDSKSRKIVVVKKVK
ncbi:MAG: 16S rRNA (guanine(527)-N(7))-methyltransferase RsmG [Elusimicrobia bacterium]|nr:16S rRNA (guanine(527)-N(7))-methyltransferase RsmG [Elusimicrobiota bacterium]